MRIIPISDTSKDVSRLQARLRRMFPRLGVTVEQADFGHERRILWGVSEHVGIGFQCQAPVDYMEAARTILRTAYPNRHAPA